MLGNVDAFGIDDPAGGLAGCVTVARYGDDVASIGMMLVASRWERHGLGRRLMEHALEFAAGRVVVLYATKLGRPLYEKLGFRVADEVTRHRGEFTAGAAAPVAVRPGGADDLAAAARLDAKACGAHRDTLLARLAEVGERMYVAADGASGHALARYEGEILVVGPLAADDEQTARALIDAHVRQAGGAVRIDVPPRFAALSAWLAECGVRPVATFPLMVYGGQLPGDRTIPYAIASFALG